MKKRSLIVSVALQMDVQTFKNTLVGKRLEEHGPREPVSWVGLVSNLLHTPRETNPPLSILESLMIPLLANSNVMNCGKHVGEN